MSVVALPRNDPAPEKTEDLFDLWISNLVDSLNTAMSQIEHEFALMDARLTAGGL